MAKIKAEPGISVGGRRTKSLGERPQQSESGRRGTETKEWVDFIVPGGEIPRSPVGNYLSIS